MVRGALLRQFWVRVLSIRRIANDSALAMLRLCQYARGQMAFPLATRPRRFAALLLAAGVALLGLALKDNFLSASYDSLHSLAALHQKPFEDPRVVIVYLDLASFLQAHQDPAGRWPRSLHAQLLQRLTAAGARAVVFDILFDTPGEIPSADAALAEALRQNGRVILAAEHNNKNSHETAGDQPWTRATMLRLPAEPFALAAAGWGVASLWVDDDFVVRRHLPALGADRTPSLSLATARFLGVTNESSERGLWLRYYGPALTLPHVSYSEALEPDALPAGFFRDKIVFIGARPVEGFMDARRDEFRSPFHAWRHKEFFMPGVETHATQLLNLLRSDALHRASAAGENLILLAVALLFGGGLLWLRPLPATLVALAGMALTPAIALAGFAEGVWFPWLIVSAVQIPAALFGSWLYQFQDWFFTRRKLEAAQRIADAKIREQAALLDKAHDAILVRDLAGRITYANPSAERLYGWTLAELQRENGHSENFSADPTGTTKARATALADGEWNGELRQQTKSGQLVIVASRWTLIRDEAGQPRELLLINSDITEQKNLEQQFLRTQRMNTIGTLAGGMAHDLNNALAPILMGTQLLRRKAVDEDSRSLLGMMETSTHRGADMVRQVLLFARGRGGDFERLELGALLKELEKLIRETFPKNITVEAFVPGDLWPVRGNPTQLHQILLNLCVNARDAMPDGGKLSLVADNVELTAGELAQFSANSPDPGPQTPDAKFVSLIVSDTGGGMSPEVRAKLFEPFFSTKGEGHGTGIGLSTVLRLVKSHGGFVRVESEPGQGSSFEVFLPRATEYAAIVTAAPLAELPRGHGETLLVAEDEKAIRELIVSELTAFGYRVLAAANGAEAVALFHQHADAVRLFITDQSMPGMDGTQAMAELRRLRPELPVILTGGEATADSTTGVMLVSKPFPLEELLTAIQRSLKPTD